MLLNLHTYQIFLDFFYSLFSGCSGGGVVAFSDAKPLTNETGESHKKKVVVLGTGWASTSFLKTLRSSSYDISVVSPRNYFAFTPLLPSVTCGTVEARSIVEPIRSITKKVFFHKLQLFVMHCAPFLHLA